MHAISKVAYLIRSLTLNLPYIVDTSLKGPFKFHVDGDFIRPRIKILSAMEQTIRNEKIIVKGLSFLWRKHVKQKMMCALERQTSMPSHKVSYDLNY
jgi:hypothetical protein